MMYNSIYERKNIEKENIEKYKLEAEQAERSGDYGRVAEIRYGKITESEALTLHAMMMTSMPYFILMKPNTLEIINRIWKFRKETKIPVCFTLDAGANVHLLYPENTTQKVLDFINPDTQFLIKTYSSKSLNSLFFCSNSLNPKTFFCFTILFEFLSNATNVNFSTP